MRAPAALFLALAPLAGCIVAEGDKEVPESPYSQPIRDGDWGSDDGDPLGDPDTGSGDATEQPLITVTWGESALTVALEGAPGGLWLGLAETGGACSGSDCWTGEDCRDGYQNGDASYGPYCHPFDSDGTITLVYDGDVAALADGTTAFEPLAAGNTTFLVESRVEDGGDGSCWVFGHDPTHYSDDGCQLADF